MIQGLTNDYVEKLCKKILINQKFYGVYPCDIQPKLSKKNKIFSIIFNTGDSSTPGEHFIALYFTPRSVFYFDSFGKKPLDQNIKLFINRNIDRRKLVCFDRKIQSDHSSFCGFFCTAFLLSKDRKITAFNRYFSKNDLDKNNQKTVYFIIKYMNNKSI